MKNKHNRFERKLKRALKKQKRNFHLTARKATLIIIPAVAAVVGIVLVLCLFLNPEARTKRQIEAMARDYYETYYYPNFKATTTGDDGFEKYVESGFPKTTLRQLLLFDGGRYKDLTDSLTEYCDENATTIQFFPVSPYSEKNYRVEYTYSCNF